MPILTTLLALSTFAGPPAEAAAAEPAPPPSPGVSLMSAAVASSDLQRSMDFYIRGLGMRSLARLDSPDVTEVVLAFPGGGPNLMLLRPRNPAADLPVRGELNRVVLAVPDLNALQARLKAAGYSLEGAPRAEAKFHVVVGHLKDPDANAIELVQHGP